MNLSIITVHFNDLQGLERTARSVRKLLLPGSMQTEWLIQDAGTIGFYEFLAAQPSLYGSARVECAKDQGIYDGMNRALQRACGEFVIFMNAGDEFFDSSALEVFLAASISDVDVLLGAAAETTAAGPVRMKRVRKSRTSLRYGMPTHHQAIYYRRNVLTRFPFRTEYGIAGDYDQLLRLAATPSVRFVFLESVVCKFYMDGVSSSSYWRAHVEQAKVRIDNRVSTRPVELMTLGVKLVARVVRNKLPWLYGKLRYFR